MTRFNYDSEARHDTEPACAFERKWLISGVTTRFTDGNIDVRVERYGGSLDARVVKAAFAHEVGHSQQFVDRDFDIEKKAGKDDRFWIEVNAWERMVPTPGIDETSYIDATLILDALNTYRRALKIGDDVWTKARGMVESWFPMLDLTDYEPLEPDEEDGEPQWEDLKTEPVDEDVDPDDEEHQEQGEGDGDPDDLKNGKDNEESGHAARDKWLYTPDGIQAAKRGEGSLRETLKGKGWDDKNLPPLTKVLAEMDKGGK